MSTPQEPQSGSDGPGQHLPPRGDGITLLDGLLMLSRGRGLIFLSIVGTVILGMLFATLSPTEYTATSKVVREAGDEAGGELPSGLSAVQGLGINLEGGGSTGLTPASYPEIATSREVRLGVARDTFAFPSTGRRTTFVDHVNRPAGLVDLVLRYTLWLPWTIKGMVEYLSGGDAGRQPVGADSTGTLIYPTKAEENAIAALEKKISASVPESGALEGGGDLMTVATTATDPILAARLNERVIDHLRTRVREIRTETTRKNLEFIKNRFDEAKQELDAAEDRLARFLEKNRSVLTGGNEPQLEFQRERLRREVRFKEQLYIQFQEQVTHTRLQLQREQPVVTIAEKPAPPTTPSAPAWTLIVLLSLFLGGLVGVFGAFLRSSFRDQQDTEEGSRKIEEVKRSFTPTGILQGVRKEMGLEKSGGNQ